jgi:hypothetical protein
MRRTITMSGPSPKLTTLALDRSPARRLWLFLAGSLALGLLAASFAQSAGAAVPARQPESVKVGGFDLTGDCRRHFDDPEAIATKGEFRYTETGWYCVVHGDKIEVTVDLLNAFAVYHYGDGAYARQDGQRAEDWGVYRDPVLLGGFDVRGDCRWYHRDPNATARYLDGSDPFSWVCESRGYVYPANLELFADYEYGDDDPNTDDPSFAYLNGQAPTDWQVYR